MAYKPTEKATAAIAQMVDDLAKDADLIAAVEAIEAKMATTRGHYGDYMAAIGTIAKGNAGVATVVARAMKQAGANAQGVDDAMRIMFPR